MLVSLVALVVVGGALAGHVTAATTIVGFEEFDTGTELTTQYGDVGVTFEAQENQTAGAVVVTCGPEVAGCTSAWDGQNVVVTPIDVFDTEIAQVAPSTVIREPLVAVFAEPQEEVSLYVREISGINGTQTAQLVARDASGENVERAAVEFDPASGWHRLSLSTSSPDISEIELTLAYSAIRQEPHNRFLVDDLTFQVNEPPEAAFGPPIDDPEAGASLTFDASGSIDPDGEIVEYRWDFDGDGSIDRVEQVPRTTATFDEPGTYPVRLEVVDDDGTTASTTVQVTVVGSPLARCSVSPSEVAPGDRVVIDASDSDAELVRFDVDGDGDVDRVNDDDFTEVVTYPDSGTVTPVVYAEIGQQRDSGRCQTITVDSVGNGGPLGVDAALGTVGGLFGVWVVRGAYRRVEEFLRDNHPPIANVAWAPRQPAPRRPVVIDGSASFDPDADDRVVSYRWTVDDRESTAPRFVTAFLEPGEHDVTLEVTDSRGATGSGTETITVEPRAGELVLDRIHPDSPGDDHQHLDQEYLVFSNAGNAVLDLGGWSVHDAAEEEGRVTPGEHTFEFPDRFELEPGTTVAIHTGAEPDEGGSFEGTDEERHLFWGKPRAVWNNEEDVVVVEDDGGHPAVAVRYARTEAGAYEFEDLDVEVLESWFPPVEGYLDDSGRFRITVGLGLRGVVSNFPGFVAGALFLGGRRTFLRNWAAIATFLLFASMTWGASTSLAVLSPSFPPTVPLLLVVAAAIMLVVGVAWSAISITTSTVRGWLG